MRIVISHLLLNAIGLKARVIAQYSLLAVNMHTLWQVDKICYNFIAQISGRWLRQDMVQQSCNLQSFKDTLPRRPLFIRWPGRLRHLLLRRQLKQQIQRVHTLMSTYNSFQVQDVAVVASRERTCQQTLPDALLNSDALCNRQWWWQLG